MLDKEVLQYKVGGLLYMPAFQANIVKKIEKNQLPKLNSIAFCLEDSIQDEFLDKAEKSLQIILRELENLQNLPLIFVRIRSPRHLETFHDKIGSKSKILTGYILPKFDMSNSRSFIKLAKEINLFIMPTLESERISSILTRKTELTGSRRNKKYGFKYSRRCQRFLQYLRLTTQY